MTTSLGDNLSAVFNAQDVERIIAEAAKSVSASLIRKLLTIFEDTKGFANKFDTELSKSNEQTQRVYGKLYKESELFISKNDKVSAVMQVSLSAIEKANPDARRQLLGFFVLAETKKLVEKLQREMPSALGNKKIWE